jgi:hypothetical protein
METFFGRLFSGAWQWLLGKLGMSDAQKLGRAEKTEETQAQVLTEVKEAHEIEDKNASARDAVIDAELRSKWERK